jgi:hypothetical protein
MRLALVVALAAAGLAAGAADARAYPQFQFSTGSERCSACHFAPAGGGLINDFGRSEAGDTISGRGDGALLHGAWTPPDWIALGADFRMASGVKQLSDVDPSFLLFPMQADLYTRVAAGPISLDLTVGLNGAARSRAGGATPLSYVISSEHFLQYQAEPDGLYVRAGRFFPVFGVRTQDHTAYPRRHLDMYLLEEPYGVGAGMTGPGWEAHVSGFIGNPIPLTRAGSLASGGTAYFEKTIGGGSGAIAGQARVLVTPDDRRYAVGAVGKYWLAGPKLMFLSELDLQRQSFVDADYGRFQMMAYLQVTRMFLPGYMVGATVQRWAPDLTLRGSTRNALELNLQAFPWAHVEAHLLTRLEATGGDTTSPNLLVLLQLHYYL